MASGPQSSSAGWCGLSICGLRPNTTRVIYEKRTDIKTSLSLSDAKQMPNSWQMQPKLTYMLHDANNAPEIWRTDSPPPRDCAQVLQIPSCRPYIAATSPPSKLHASLAPSGLYGSRAPPPLALRHQSTRSFPRRSLRPKTSSVIAGVISVRRARCGWSG